MRPVAAPLPRAMPAVPISLLDRSRTRSHERPEESLRATVHRAERAEKLGYHRFWVAEHHGVPGIASAAPTVLMAAVAAATSTIRVGSGGVMLPNHQPLVVAEQARTLAALHPGRIDLGIGRSLGFTSGVRKSLRVTEYSPEAFDADLDELLAHLGGTGPVRAVPEVDERIGVHLLATGSGLAVAARHGLPVVVGGPALHTGAGLLAAYRHEYRPSQPWPEPRVTISLEILIAGTVEEARELLLPEAVALAESRRTGVFAPLRPVRSTELDDYDKKVRSAVERQLRQAVYGTASQVHEQLTDLVRRTGADEVLATTSTYDRDALAAADTALAGLDLRR
ncbi:MAG TPA: MsnO8 family LLM class oxidoreductase [Ruania sp.]|nr:MsnO8 family LLM class oxidoreductase [Ruania sp.]